MIIIHCQNTSGINILYPSLYHPKSGIIRVAEIFGYEKKLPLLFLLDAIILLLAITNIYDHSMINCFIISFVTIVIVIVRVKFLPFIDIQVNGIQSTSIAPFSLIFEHIVHNFGIILVGVAAAIGGGEVVKNLIFFLMPVAIVLLVLPFVNLLVNYMEGNEY